MSVQGPAGPAGPAGTAGALTSRSQVYTVKSAVTAVNYTSVNEQVSVGIVDDRLDPEETAHRRAGREVAKRRQVA